MSTTSLHLEGERNPGGAPRSSEYARAKSRIVGIAFSESVTFRDREGDHCVTQYGTLAGVATEAIYDVLAAVHDINGRRGICAARMGHGRGLEGPQDLPGPCICRVEKAGAFAKEGQVAGDSNARVGLRGHGILPGHPSAKRVYRSVDTMAGQTWAKTHAKVVLKSRISHQTFWQITRMRVEQMGSWAISCGRPFHSSIEQRLEDELGRFLRRSPLRSSRPTGRERGRRVPNLVLRQRFHQGFGLGGR